MKGPLIQAIYFFIKIIDTLILARVILSWLQVSRNNKVIEILYQLTEPILGPIRNLLSKTPLGGPGMMLDFSPIIALFLMEFIGGVLVMLVQML